MRSPVGHAPHLPQRDGFATRIALFYAALFAVFGVHLPFFPVFLDARGLDAAAIGLVMGASLAVRLVATPVATALADRSGRLDRALLLCSLGGLLCTVATGFAEGFWPILIITVAHAVAFGPVVPIADGLAARGLAARGLAYGPVRLWGSVSFIAAGLGAGLALDAIAPGDVIWLIVAALAVTALACLVVPRQGGAPAGPSAAASAGRLRSRAVLLVVAGGALISASHAVLYAFSTLHWTGQGLSGGFVGLLWALGVMAEIVVFAFSARLTALFGPAGLILAGAAGGVVRFTALAFDPPAAALPALQLLHGLSFGTTHLGLVAFLQRAAGAQHAATAQGLSATANAALVAAATAGGGLLYAAYGAGAYLAMAALAGAGGVLVLAARGQPHKAGAGG